MSDFKAIDFHIHTLRTLSDNKELDFSKERLKNYVSKLELKAIAITNHNLFDKDQFEEITDYLSTENVVIFPGIEVDLENAHILVISPADSIDSFSEACNKISAKVTSQGFSLNIEEFNEIFCDILDDCLLIPHYKKAPAMSSSIISRINTTIIVGETQNPKKFELMKKDNKGISSFGRMDGSYNVRFDKMLQNSYLNGEYGATPIFETEEEINKLFSSFK